MIAGARFAHVNLVARDWQRLARFYEEVLGCVPVPPPRDLAGPALEAATGVPGARLSGVHLRLPGHGDAGPTLEIFQYLPGAAGPAPAINRPGLGHLAFAVADVEEARDAVLRAGGGVVGEIVRLAVPGAGTVTFLYATDPEGNILELQSWSRA
jgi:catechol 2,3-dioxygenase-like lactoylglutathione lyase family enzyme